MVLLYFLRVQHQEYAAEVMVLSPEVLFNIWLDLNTFRLCSDLKRCYYTAGTNAYSTKDAHYLINELKLQCNNLSGGGDAYGIAQEKSQLGTLQCG